MHVGGQAAVRILDVEREAVGAAQLRGRGILALVLAQVGNQRVVAVGERLDGVADVPGGECVKHSVGEYVRRQDHTNGIESFWSMLKRGHVASTTR